jgi:hypothetical protein
MDLEMVATFASLTYREQWLALKEIMKLHDMYALDCVQQPAPVSVAVECLPGPLDGRTVSAPINRN